MLRVFLVAGFLLAFSIPSFADKTWSCAWCRAAPAQQAAYAHAGAARHVDFDVPAEPFPGGMNGPVAVSVIYPGIVVLMTMAAYFFLRAMEPQAESGQPRFICTTVGLSALWLFAFYPFLSSALGDFLFCITGCACVGGWYVVRRYGLPARPWETALVLWAFFFFSLLAGVIATGYGRGVGAAFDGALNAVRESTAAIGPLLLLAVNGAAVLFVFTLAGVKVPSQVEPENLLRFRIYTVVVAVALLDTYVAESRSFDMQWLRWPLFALPSLAYYGIYWLVSRLPEALRLRAGLALFVALAMFLALLVCLAQGSTAAAMLLVATGLAHGAALVFGLAVLWQSPAAKGVKTSLSAAAAALVLGACWVGLGLHTLTPDDRAAFLAERLLPALLNARMLAVVFLAFICGIYAFLSPRFSPSARVALAALMLSFLLLLHASANALPASLEL